MVTLLDNRKGYVFRVEDWGLYYERNAMRKKNRFSVISKFLRVVQSFCKDIPESLASTARTGFPGAA